MDIEEIRKWKRSAIKALGGRDLSTEARAQLSAAAAMWEIAMQLAILNERESERVSKLRDQLTGELDELRDASKQFKILQRENHKAHGELLKFTRKAMGPLRGPGMATHQ